MANEASSDVPHVTPVSSWRPARKFPLTYPGDCPDHSYLLHDEDVLPVTPSSASGEYLVLADGDWQPLDVALQTRGSSGLSGRTPVIAYGANRNPATLHAKLRNYGAGGSIPVLKGSLTGADVVACGLHGQGYLYGDLLLSPEYVADTVLDICVLALDSDQLRAINDSEGISSGMYSLATIGRVSIEGVDKLVAPLAYLANERVFISPELHLPIAYSGVGATGRSLPSMQARDVLEHAIQTLGIADAVSDATGLDPSSLVDDLAKYLNGQWWYQFHTGDRPLEGYRRVLEIFSTMLAQSSVPTRTLDRVTRDGLLLTAASAYAPGARFTWGALISDRHV
jgi:hypothetical protein